ncbi:MAG: glycoside hydrolase family 97 protein [Bacteroidales bacterium]|nr:glycoside hydrolase family 97 protein [Bacteroidales bacterium]
MKLIFLIITISANLFFIQAKEYKLSSPDQRIKIIIETDNEIHFSVLYNNQVVIKPSIISMQLEGKEQLSVKVIKTNTRTVNEIIHPTVATKNAIIPDHFNELKIAFRDNYNIIFRAYDDGISYRFQTSFNKEITVLDEKGAFVFAGDYPIYFPKETSFFSHNEREYIYTSLNELEKDEFCSLPALIAPEKGPKILITESDISDYPGMWLSAGGSNGLNAIFPKAAAEEKQKNDRNVPVVKRENYLAKTVGKRDFPWRVFIMVEKDGDLIESEMVYRLAKPNQLDDISWIKPGKVAWDWWNALNIYGVDFKSGVNTSTYKYFIDFAADFGLEYIVLDEGWYKLGDLMTLNPEIDMEEICSYGESKNVGIILWVVWKTLDDQLEESLNQFKEWGVKGIKVDFMQRDDVWMVNYYTRIAKEAAKRKLLVDYHGAYKPSGLRRTYPNVITREGVKGLENCKWSADITPEHNLTIPFIRMVAGPMDYTPGAMVNKNPKNYSISFTSPMSMGTRLHQMAMYVVYESPLQMLADNPSNYYKEEECTEFISKVPVTWDETKVLDAKISDYILIARRKGKDWFLAAMTDDNDRELIVDLSFLDSGNHSMEMFSDGINASRHASDYKKEALTVTSNDKLTILLAKGGGWVARIK